MLFSPTLSSPLTPSAVKIERENLKQFELENFSRYSILSLLKIAVIFYDALLIQLWLEMELSEQQGISLIAVGGYGRREMFPLSDLDFLILVEQTPIPEIEEKLLNLSNFLWDCGFEVGNSVRTLEQCELEGKQDITIATNLLEARFLAGNRPHFDALNELVKRADFWSKEDFF